VSSLDDPARLKLDSLGLLATAGTAPEAFEEGAARADAVELLFPAEAVANVAVCGMGGSAIAGDLVAGAFAERLRKPVSVVRGYELPGWVGEDTLVVLSSYSGDTEETLTCTMQAYERASLCVAITSGGKLASFYAKEGIPVVAVPPGLQPRAALPWMLGPLVALLERLEVLPPLGPERQEARETLAAAVAAYGPTVPEAANPAKGLARELLAGLPLIWGAELTASVARRWKDQINENAKVPAFASTLPELDHNEIAGIAGIGALGAKTRVVMLRDPRNHRQVVRRFALTQELVQREVAGVLSITAEGQGALARMLDLVMLGDYVSIYLALLSDVDPGPIPVIARLKERLASTGFGRTAGEGEAAP
jgi:glucose/mannose-6-phosphate isomerase